MRAKSLALLSLALGCGLVASIGITQVMAKRAAPAVAAGATENIYVAARDIPLNEVLVVGLLKLEQWPKDKVPPGSIGKLEEIEGRRCRTRLYAGEAILKTKLFGKGQDLGGTSSQIPKGMRVVPVRVDAVSGASGLILPGDRVDVLVHLLANPSAGIREPCTRTVLQNVKVFAADTQTDLERVEGDSKSIQAKTISLLLTPEQAQKITLATELGQVRLVMRAPDDETNTQIEGVTPRELFGTAESGKLLKDTVPAGEGNATASQEFLTLLKSSLAAKPATPPVAEAKPAAPPPPPRFRMQVLVGDRPGEAVFEARKEPGSTTENWALVSDTVAQAKATADAEAKAKADALAAEEAKAKARADAEADKRQIIVRKDADGKVQGVNEVMPASEYPKKPSM
jgi:pilus assembly protein CpaB